MNAYDPNYVPHKNPFLLGVKVLIVNDNGEALVLWRSANISRPHGIDLPGGAVDPGEGPDDAAVREVLEETGITVTNPKLVCTQYLKIDGDDAVVLGYSVRLTGNTPEVVLSWEHEAYEWRPIGDVDRSKLPLLIEKLFKSLD